MKNKNLIIVLFFIFTLCASTASALVIKHQAPKPKKFKEITVTSFLDYPPFGYSNQSSKNKNDLTLTTAYDYIINKFANDNELKVINVTWIKDYNTSVQSVRGGSIDVIIGIYHETKLYRGIDIIFPAIIKNPITVFTLPHNIDKIKSLDDLQKLKGIMSPNEHLTDYVANEIKNYNITIAKDNDEVFEKLFTNQVDYIVGSHYYILIEAAKLGLKDKIGIAKQTIWSMPLFIGVSKLSKYRNFLATNLTKISESEETQKNINESLIESIYKIEEQYKGVVPPMYSIVGQEEISQ